VKTTEPEGLRGEMIKKMYVWRFASVSDAKQVSVLSLFVANLGREVPLTVTNGTLCQPCRVRDAVCPQTPLSTSSR
jgi:hypothetical protein